MNRHSFFLSLLFALFVSPAFANTASIYFNGDILTMEGDSPNYAEALVVRGSDIAFVGDKSKAIALAGKDAKQIDLKGATLLPGFIDSWGHFTLIAQNTLGVNLAYFSAKPPQNKAQLIQKLQKEGKPFNGWLLGNGYADPFLSDGPLTLADLDKAFPTQPLLLSNISTLTGITNSAGLKKTRHY